ncbi:hypothetical protein B0O99DRAFT_679217 [Bisporella sp. PMI_857]|nr:hypothetical protein B0O99DRAFT_679217 [Bisporella sp. PMI_857]
MNLGQYSPISEDFVTKFVFEKYKTPTAFSYSIIVRDFYFCRAAALESRERANKTRFDSSGAVFTIGFSLSVPTKVDHFVAKKKKLARLHNVLGEKPDRRTAVIHGLGGISKTQIVVTYAKRHRNDYSAVL